MDSEKKVEQQRKPGRPRKQEQEAFVGFTQASIHQEYFRMPTIWMNVCATIDNLAELKVVQYVLRHTWGFREYETAKQITLDEFANGRKYKDGTRMDFGTGLSEKAVKEGLNRAIAHGFLICEVDDRDKARIKKYYALNMQQEGEAEQVDQSEENDIPGEGNNNPPREEYYSPRSKNELKEQIRQKKVIRKAHPSQEPETIRSLRPPARPRDRGHTAPSFIRRIIDDFSRDLGDDEHLISNITQTSRLYEACGLDPDAFRAELYAARAAARRAYVKKRNSRGRPNRMPYFFACLSNLVRNETELRQSG